MSLPDFPDFMVRGLPTDVVEVDTSLAVPFVMQSSANVAAGALQQYDFEFTDEDYIYQPCYIIISPTTLTEHVDYIYFYTTPNMVGAGAGNKVYPVHENPALQYIAGDTLTVKVRNANASARTIYVTLSGTRYPRPAGWIHPPYVMFHATPVKASPDQNIQFTDDSYNTPTAWLWEFGDEGSSELQNPVHSYAAEGTYDVSLFASNAAGFDKYIRDNYILITTYEPTAAYTEVDPNTDITLSAYNCVFDTMANNIQAYVYKDFGAGHFNAYEVTFRFKLSSNVSNDGMACVAAFKNTIASVGTGGGFAVVVMVYQSSAGPREFYLVYYNNNTLVAYDKVAGITTGQYYYGKLVHAAGSQTATLYIYTDEQMTTLFDTLSITDAGVATTWRYFYMICARNWGKAGTVSGEGGNFTFV
jgi:PKD repeat protein